jgi:hypothetical protein
MALWRWPEVEPIHCILLSFFWCTRIGKHFLDFFFLFFLSSIRIGKVDGRTGFSFFDWFFPDYWSGTTGAGISSASQRDVLEDSSFSRHHTIPDAPSQLCKAGKKIGTLRVESRISISWALASTATWFHPTHFLCLLTSGYWRVWENWASAAWNVPCDHVYHLNLAASASNLVVFIYHYGGDTARPAKRKTMASTFSLYDHIVHCAIVSLSPPAKSRTGLNGSLPAISQNRHNVFSLWNLTEWLPDPPRNPSPYTYERIHQLKRWCSVGRYHRLVLVPLFQRYR